MSIWRSFRKANVEQKSNLASPEVWLTELFGATPALSGVAVTPSSAMRCTAVRRAVQAIAEPVGQLPLHVFHRSGDARKRDRDHAVSRVLRDPNPWTSASDFREQLQRDCLLWGNAYAFINRIGGKPAELIRLDPASVTVLVDSASGEPRYRLSGEPIRTYAAGDVFHLKSPSIDGYCGRSIVTDCREAIGVALILEQHAATLFGRGGRPDGILKTDSKLGAEAAGRIATAWRAKFGDGKSGGTPVLEQGLEFQSIGFNSVDSQFLELRRYAVDEIARAFGVPPHLLYEMGRATWGNSAELGSNFVTFTLLRWLKAWQGEIRLKLFNEKERDERYAEFLVDDLLKADIAARSTAYSQLIAARVLNPNEARARENLPPYAGGDVFANPNVQSGETANG